MLSPAAGRSITVVVTVDRYGLLCVALMAGASAAGAWCAEAGVPEFGVAAAAQTGVEPARLLLVPDPGAAWPRVVASLLDGCEIVAAPPAPGDRRGILPVLHALQTLLPADGLAKGTSDGGIP